MRIKILGKHGRHRIHSEEGLHDNHSLSYKHFMYMALPVDSCIFDDNQTS